MQTATFISEVCNLEIRTDIELRERNMEIFQGYTRSEMKQNAIFNSFLKDNGKWSLEVWGDSSHLENL